MLNRLHELVDRYLTSGYFPHVATVAGLLFALFLISKLFREKRAPANTFAWLLLIILVPYAGVPLYLLLGGRKLRRLAERKTSLTPVVAGKELAPCAASSVAAALVAAGAGPAVGGNRFVPVEDGQQAFALLEERIRQARHSIHIATFILGRDDTGRRLVQLLAQRARDGVKVRLLLDAFGCIMTSTSFVRPLRRAGGEIGRFMPVLPLGSRTSANLRNHRKIAVFDRTAAFVGGHNLGRQYMGPLPLKKRWTDFGALIEGPAAIVLDEVFIADWCFATRQPPESVRGAETADRGAIAGSSELQIVPSGPDVPGDPLYEGIIAMIQEAERSVRIVTPYFIPDEVLLRSLIVKARSGREVTLVVPARSNHPITDLARKLYVRQLRRAGGRVLLYGPGMLHAKAVIVDNRVALMGSPNMDLRSLFVNFEIGVLAHSPEDVARMNAWFRSLSERSREWVDEAVPPGILSEMLEDLSRLLAPLL